MHLFLILLALTVFIGVLGFGFRWYYSEAQIKRRDGRSRILGPYKRW